MVSQATDGNRNQREPAPTKKEKVFGDGWEVDTVETREARVHSVQSRTHKAVTKVDVAGQVYANQACGIIGVLNNELRRGTKVTHAES